MKRPLLHLADRILDTPLAIDEGKLSTILDVLGPRLEVSAETLDQLEAAGATPVAASPASVGRKRAPSATDGGVATIDVIGTLVHRHHWVNALSGLTSYEQLSGELAAAVADPAVETILLRFDSPGGEVSGLFDMADAIFEARSSKRVVAVAEDMAASAAYVLASAAGEFYATEGGIVGSIGIVVAMRDATNPGSPRVTHFHAGAKKMYPGRALDLEGMKQIQGRVDGLYDVMTAKVATYRGISQQEVKDTEAATFLSAEALKLKLIDGVQSTRRLRAASRPATNTQAALASDTPISSSGLGISPSAGVNDEQEVPVDLKDEKKSDAGASTPASAPVAVQTSAQTAAAVDLVAENSKLKADLEKSQARVALADLAISQQLADKKAAVIAKHQARGAIVAAQIPSVEKIAGSFTVEELDAELAKWPTVLRTVAQIEPKLGELAATLPATLDVGAIVAEDRKGLKSLGVTEQAIAKFDQIQGIRCDGTVLMKDGSETDMKTFNGGRA